jgi:hypothetical protein
MAVREYKFDTGPETPTLPTATTPSASTDIMTKAYADSQYGATVTGTRASPTSVTAAGFTPGTAYRQRAFVQGSGGAVTITANPRIAAGSIVGQVLTLVGCSDTNTLTIAHGNGLVMNGPIELKADSKLHLSWDGTNWTEDGRVEY